MTGRDGANPPLSFRLAVVDGHQGIIDGYHFRFDRQPNTKIVVAALNGADFEEQLARNPADVALVDLRAPVSFDNPAPYPLLHAIPRLLSRYPDLAVLVFAMSADPYQIKAVMEAGASGFIVKNDAEIYSVLPEVLASIYQGGVFYSSSAQAALHQTDTQASARPLLTRRQLEALSLCAAFPRHAIGNIALQMNVSSSTARNLLSKAYERLGVTTRMEAVLRAQKLGLLPPHSSD